MNTQLLIETAKKLFADDKGLLAMDESNPTCDKRFAKLGIPQTVEARRAYREMIITTPGLADSISGVILYDETIRQQKQDGTPFLKVLAEAGIISGIKVDTGAKDLAAHPGEKITEGGGGPASPAPSSQVQPRGAPRRIQRRNGKDLNVTNNSPGSRGI